MDSATTTSLDEAAVDDEMIRRSARIRDRSGVENGSGNSISNTNGGANGEAVKGSVFRDKSPTRAEIRKAFQKKYRHVAAVHKVVQPSCLSHDSHVSPSFLGFRNLMVIVLVVGNLRLMLENIQKYGVLICVRCHDFREDDVFWGALLFLLIPCHLFIAHWIELWQANAAGLAKQLRDHHSRDGTASPTVDESRRFNATWITVAWLHGINYTVALIYQSLIVYYNIHHPLIGTITEMHAVILGLKTISYAFTNRDLRHAFLHPVTGELEALPEIYTVCPYPSNITVRNICYFWWAPTLVYQPAYPRSPGPVRWIYVVKRLGEAFGLGVFIWFISAQYAAPVLRNSLDSIDALDLTSMVERLLKLSTISLVIWLAGFFALFQSFLNALAEMLQFGDRSFYDEWWNSPSLGAYWRTWNKPVYSFFRRHIYSPMLGRGWSGRSAMLVVFTVSALLHELLVGVPTHNIIWVAFLGMMFQIPLIALTGFLEKLTSPAGKLIGNCIFWVSFTILGQPAAALIYFYTWQYKYGSVSRQINSS